MFNSPEPKTIDEMAVEAVRLGREVADAARFVHLGGNVKDVAFVARALSNLRERQPLRDADEGSLEAVREIIATDLAREVTDHENRFFATDCDECGPIGETRKVPVYTDRGNNLLELQSLFEQFTKVRAAVFDHLAAHRLLIEKMDA
ncbi:MAG: hypothetical protein ABJO97_00030 [Roseibium sp.]